jgi:acyl-coenzyme A synthetase/AMP-(fatty) acid ligase
MHNLAEVLFTRNQHNLSLTAFCDENRSIDYGTLQRQSQQFAGWLRRDGLQPGDRVAIVLPDSINTVIAFLGTVLAGGVAVMTSPQGRRETINYKINHVDPKLVIDRNNIDLVLSQSRQALPDTTVTGGGKNVAFMLWTSGTTGNPKAVMHTHDNVFAQCLAVGELTVGLAPHDRIYSTAKLSFAYGIIYSLFNTMWAGAQSYLDAGLATPGRVKHNIEQFGPSVFLSVPVLYSQLINKLDPRTDVKFISSGDRLPQALLTHWLEKFGVPIYNCMGTTEGLTSYIFNHKGTPAIGQAVPTYKTRIVDDQGHAVARGQAGQLQVLAPSIGLGYWQDPQWTADYFKDWVTTGDTCYEDEQGNLHHLGRRGDVIKIAGHFINPAELEETLYQCNGVEQAAVVSIPNEHGVEHIEAYVVGQADPVDLMAWMNQHHDRQQCPRRFHIVAELPRTDSGKIQRYKLRA